MYKYKVLNNEIVAMQQYDNEQIIVSYAKDLLPYDDLEWQETEREIVNANGILCFADSEEYKVVKQAAEVESIKQGLIATVQAHLNKLCQQRGYDNGFACASYIASGVPKFKAEAEAYVLWRDAVWSYCYEQLDLFEKGERDIPTDIIAELPKLEW